MQPGGVYCDPRPDVLGCGMRTRGRAGAAVEVEILRDLTPGDLELLDEPRDSKPTPITKRMSERHHALARLLSSGVADWEAAAMTGYCASHISILKTDPTFKDLLHFYREKVDVQVADLHNRLSGLSIDALDELRGRLENQPESIKPHLLLEMIKVGADRTGHGPSSTNLQVNVGLAQRLEAARKRVTDMIDITPENPK
jgi:hypothetical protein